MPSVWDAIQPTSGEDELLEALAERGRASGSPWAQGQSLPLPEVDYSLVVNPSEIRADATWPPARIQPQHERLQCYFDLWRGDITAFVDRRLLAAAGVGGINIFRRISKFVADLLIREAPTANQASGDEVNDTLLMRLIHDLATDAIRYGAAHLFMARTDAGLILRVVDSRYVLPTDTGGWIIGEPRTSINSINTTPDTTQIILLEGGQANVSIHRSANETYGVGPVVAAGMLGEAHIWPILALPSVADHWGTSWYEDLITVVVQTARRMAANAIVLDENSDPLLLLRGDLDRYTAIPGVEASSAVTSRPEDIKREGQIGKRLWRGGPVVLDDGIENGEYVTWDGSLEWSMAALDRIDRHFRLLSGMPAVLDSDAEVPSGMSLRRMFWQFDAGIAPLYHSIHQTLTAALDILGLNLEWENTFEAVQDTPTMTATEDVANEATARRGEAPNAQPTQ